VSAAIFVVNTGENDLIAAGKIMRVTSTVQQKTLSKTKVFERVSKLSVGTDKKEAA